MTRRQNRWRHPMQNFRFMHSPTECILRFFGRFGFAIKSAARKALHYTGAAVKPVDHPLDGCIGRAVRNGPRASLPSGSYPSGYRRDRTSEPT
jgi:hypothetical protein